MHKKIRILHVSATSTGGVGLNLLLLARHMDRNRFELSFALPQDSHFFRSIAAEGVTVYPLSIARNPFRPRNLRGMIELLRILRRGRYDIVHSHTSVGGLLGRVLAKVTGARRVLWSIHGWAFNYPGRNRLKRAVFRTIEKALDAVTNHYVAVCENMRQIAVTSGIADPSKISVIYHGLDPRSYRVQQPAPVPEGRVAGGCVTIGTIGRFEPQKAMDDFLRSAGLISTRHPEARFVLVGDGPQREELRALSGRLGLADKVTFLPWTNDVRGALASLDAFCMTSHWEAMPFMLLEAMAMGKPVIATAVGGVPEVLEDGVNGILVPPGDCRQTAEAMSRLIGDRTLRNVMAERNRAKIAEQYSISVMIDAYGALYERLVR